MAETDAVDNLTIKQRELMAKVPHPLRKDSYARAQAVVTLFEKVLVYMNSTGHKPWRPTPLDSLARNEAMGEAIKAFQDLFQKHVIVEPESGAVDTTDSRILVSTFGAIEEAIEFYRSTEVEIVSAWETDEEARAHMLEELTDELFFFLERMILAGFTWSEIITEYHRKWDVNMKRYADAEKGDMSWDDRAGKEGL